MKELAKQISIPTLTENGVCVYSPDPIRVNEIGYVRGITLKHNNESNGNIYLIFENHILIDGKESNAVYRSVDGGVNWEHAANVADNWQGTKWCTNPVIFELPRAIGDMPQGTLLVSGLFWTEDKSQGKMLLLKSLDLGYTWDYVSTVDVGGPLVFDDTQESTTTTIWEPFLGIDGNGELVCYYSDERQKPQQIHQAVCRRSSADGITWGELTNVCGVPNFKSRPGMVVVSKMGNGKYIAMYEVHNAVPPFNEVEGPNDNIMYKISEDGIEWHGEEPGIVLRTADGAMAWSAPYVKWFDVNHENGMVIVDTKWMLNANGHNDHGGCFFVNYNYGAKDEWVRFPMALDYDAIDLLEILSGWAAAIDISPDGKWLYQFACVDNPYHKSGDIHFAALPLFADYYEAEQAKLIQATAGDCLITNFNGASGGRKVSNIKHVGSGIEFDNIQASQQGEYTVIVRYLNGSGEKATHLISVNGEDEFSLSYPPLYHWKRAQWVAFRCELKEGMNTIRFISNGLPMAELDCIGVYQEG